MPRSNPDRELTAGGVVSHLGVMLAVSALVGLLVAGIAIVAETMACLDAGELVVSDHGLREGLLLQACAPDPRFDSIPGDV